MVVLKYGDRRPAVRFLQAGINERSESRGFPQVVEDGILGYETQRAVQRVGRAMGAMESTLREAREDREVSIGLQRMIRCIPDDNRTPEQLQRARDRARADEAEAAGPLAALTWARKWIGYTEDPPGSNRGDWGLTQWQQDLGSWLVGQAWCGVFVGTALIRAGVQGINYRVAAVRFIHEDASMGRNGFEKRVGVRDGRPGDAVGLFGLSTHVEIIEKRVAGGYQTIGGNTSSSDAGSQSNGGGVFRRVRPYSHVVYVARPRW